MSSADDDDPSASSANDARAQARQAGMSRNEVYELRLMAQYPHVLDRVISESTDESPPTKRKVLAAIRAERGLDHSRRSETVRHRLARLIDEFGVDAVSDAFMQVLHDLENAPESGERRLWTTRWTVQRVGCESAFPRLCGATRLPGVM